MGKTKETKTRAQRKKEISVREQKKHTVTKHAPESVSDTVGVHLDVPSDLLEKHTVSGFKKQVYAIAQQIPAGKVASYGQIAEVLGSSPRAVGGALKNNPFAPIVPCHRVVASDGSMGGFQGETSGENIDKKVDLLKAEGVKLDFTSGSARVEEKHLITKEELQKVAASVISPSKSPKAKAVPKSPKSAAASAPKSPKSPSAGRTTKNSSK